MISIRKGDDRILELERGFELGFAGYKATAPPVELSSIDKIDDRIK